MLYYRTLVEHQELPGNPDAVPITQAIGDHNGLHAVLLESGCLITFFYDVPSSFPGPRSVRSPDKATADADPEARLGVYQHPFDEEGPRLAALACTSTGLTACIPLQAPGASTLHILMFPRFGTTAPRSSPDQETGPDNDPETGTLLAHLTDPPNPLNRATAHHSLPGRPHSLLATATAFVLLTTAPSRVYTWGDHRYPTVLGRPVTSRSPASQPGVVDAVDGLGVKKIVAAQGGWMMAALSEAGEAWAWGFEGPSGGGAGSIATVQGVLRDLRHEEAQEQERGWLQNIGEEVEAGLWKIVLPTDKRHDADAHASDPPDDDVEILDLALGKSHILALDATGRVRAIGSNSHGQLGLGPSAPKLVRSWIAVPLPFVEHEGDDGAGPKARQVVGIAAGDLGTFVRVSRAQVGT